MELLSEDDLNLKDMTPEELDRAWDLWFDLAQVTNDFDPPWMHGVFLLCDLPPAPTVGGLSRTESTSMATDLDLTKEEFLVLFTLGSPRTNQFMASERLRGSFRSYFPFLGALGALPSIVGSLTSASI
jgi:hypothetical protein